MAELKKQLKEAKKERAGTKVACCTGGWGRGQGPCRPKYNAIPSEVPLNMASHYRIELTIIVYIHDLVVVICCICVPACFICVCVCVRYIVKLLCLFCVICVYVYMLCARYMCICVVFVLFAEGFVLVLLVKHSSPYGPSPYGSCAYGARDIF